MGQPICLEGQGTGLTSRGSVGGRDSNGGLREKTGRNLISSDSARVCLGRTGSGVGASVEDAGGAVSVDGLFSSKPRYASVGGVEGGGGGFNHRQTVPEPPRYQADGVAVTQEPQSPVPSPSYPVPVASVGSTAPAFAVSNGNGNGCHGAARARPGVEAEPAYLFTDAYPFTFKQFDRREEDRLMVSNRVIVQVWFREHKLLVH